MSKEDEDFRWLLGHLKECGESPMRTSLLDRVHKAIKARIEQKNLPYTLGLFGPWGAGKTTFLAQLAKRLEAVPKVRTVYFNAWKYAGLTDLLPALVYKILRFGVPERDAKANKLMSTVLLSIGDKYSSKFGDWVEQKVGVNPAKVYKDCKEWKELVEDANRPIPKKVLDAYYTEVDRIQEQLLQLLGNAEKLPPEKGFIVALVDELDRCDPDEAFNVLKQLRALFAMRHVPVIFVISANPEPIGLAIKHRYGLDTDNGNYEARRMLEKFVDAYEELADPTELGHMVKNLWKDKRAESPWILSFDHHFIKGTEEKLRDKSGYDVMTTANPCYSNLRVLKKSFDYVSERALPRDHLVWSAWHLEILSQIDPDFRRDIRILSKSLKYILRQCYQELSKYGYTIVEEHGKKRVCFEQEEEQYRTTGQMKGLTVFAILLSLFYERCNDAIANLRKSTDPEENEEFQSLDRILRDTRRVEFVVVLSLLPVTKGTGFEPTTPGVLPSYHSNTDLDIFSDLAHLLANYKD